MRYAVTGMEGWDAVEFVPWNRLVYGTMPDAENDDPLLMERVGEDLVQALDRKKTLNIAVGTMRRLARDETVRKTA